jgi:hypothetical protein
MLVRESISFQRGANPKQVLGIGEYKIIKDWLDEYFIETSYATKQSSYIINDDLTIDVDGFFAMSWNGNFPEFIKFKKVTSNFQISRCNMTSLRGCPEIVHGSFECHSNNLKNLIGGPIKVDENYGCSLNPNIQSLAGIAKYIGGDFYCNNKAGLTEKDIPTDVIIKRDIEVSYWSNW